MQPRFRRCPSGARHGCDVDPVVRGKLVTRGKAKWADYILYIKPNIPVAVIEAKDNNHSVGDGMQQALEYAVTLDIPFVFSSNGDGFLFQDRSGTSVPTEANLRLDKFPTPEDLWTVYRLWKKFTPEAEATVLQDYYDDGSGKAPRYDQVNAVNAAIKAIAQGQNRVLLVMATGTGKTCTAFQIIWRLWKAQQDQRDVEDALTIVRLHITVNTYLLVRTGHFVSAHPYRSPCPTETTHDARQRSDHPRTLRPGGRSQF